MVKRYLIFFLWLFLFLSSLPIPATADYLVGGTQNYPLSIDPDLGSSDTTVSSQNAVYTYITNNCAPANGYLITTQNVPSLTNEHQFGELSKQPFKSHCFRRRGCFGPGHSGHGLHDELSGFAHLCKFVIALSYVTE